MSKNGERLKEWRKFVKEQIIIAMGSKCCICSYDKCRASLALHHLDPLQKDFAFNKITASSKNWDNFVQELRKCVLVCHNCHAEIHSDMAVVPINAPRFNEKFAGFSSIKDTLVVVSSPCPVCGELKSSHLKHCSRKCAARSRYKIDWDNINLSEELKIKSIVQLADEFGCSDGAIHKRMKKLGLK